MNQNKPGGHVIAPPAPNTIPPAPPPAGDNAPGQEDSNLVLPPEKRAKAPPTVLIGALLWMIALAALFFTYLMSSDFRDYFPDAIGVVPIEVIWFGAIAGLLKSYSGIFHYHRNKRADQQWDDRYNPWHLLRPPIGAITGGISCLLFVVLIRTAGGTLDENAVDDTMFFAVAFVFGYAESAFRAQIKALTDALVRPGEEKPAA